MDKNKIIRKNIILPALMAALLGFALGSCTYGSGTIKNGTELNTPNKMSMTYEEFTGFKETQIRVADGQTVEVSVRFVTEKGSIDAFIVKDNKKENSSYEGHSIPTSNFTVTLKEQGVYTIRVDAKNHTGSYSFSW